MTAAVFGEALMDLVGGADAAYRAYPGGSPYNFAIGLARQGVNVSFLAPFSDDAFGGRLLDALRREGVATPIARRSRLPTSLALVTVDAAGVPSYRLYRHAVADTDIAFEEIAAHLPQALDFFHTGSLALSPDQVPKVEKLCASMRERGTVVSIDLNVRLQASLDPAAYLTGVRSLLPLADIVKGSDEDFVALGFDSNPRRCAEIAYGKMRGGLLVLTEGSAGAVVHAAAGTIARAAYPVNPIADTIGAGDAFHAAFMAYLTRAGAMTLPLGGLGRAVLESALEFACAAAAINVSRVGCAPPSRPEVERFLRRR